MGTLHQRSLLCERSRGWVSLSLDGELSEFERALLDAHLGRCAECSVFAADTRAATTLLRAAPLERPLQQISPPAIRRRIGASALRVGAAAAVVVGALGLAGSMTVSSGPRVSAVPRGASDQTSDRLIRIAQRQSLTPAPLIDRGRSVLTLPL
jgi:anti-sigma factor RsiW